MFENVELPLTYRGMPTAERKQRVIDALERVRHGAPAASTIRRSSRAVSSSASRSRARSSAIPSILLADEPTGNLDSKNGEAVMGCCPSCTREGATICMVTHDPRYAAYADRNIHMFDGRVVDEETLHRLREEEDQRIAEQARRGRPQA